MNKALLATGLALSLALTGCGIGGLQDVKAKTENLKTKEELERAVGKPTKVSGVTLFGGSAEAYVYETSDGTATFGIINGKIESKLYTPKDVK